MRHLHLVFRAQHMHIYCRPPPLLLFTCCMFLGMVATGPGVLLTLSSVLQPHFAVVDFCADI
jgi:hypothetical protein